MALGKYIWPDWMPHPQVNGYGIQPVDRRTKTDMEMGGIYRVEFDTDECTCQCSLVLDRDQAAWFETFERDVLKQGSVWFELPLWIGGQVKRHVVRMQDRPRAGELIGLHTTYTLTLDVRERNLMSEDEAEGLLEYPPGQMRKFDDVLHHIVNEMMPEFTLLSFPLFPEINYDQECEMIVPSEECVYE